MPIRPSNPDPKPGSCRAKFPRPGARPRIMAEQKMLAVTIRAVYESYGFEPLETPAFGIYRRRAGQIPCRDVDRPAMSGVFSSKR